MIRDRPKVCLDAGHYGYRNQSPVLKEYYESIMTWRLHLLLRSELERYGIEVITTRLAQNVDLTVFERGKKAEGCDMFISLHSNAADDAKVDRVVVYVPFDARPNVKNFGAKVSSKIAELMDTVDAPRVSTRESKGTEYYGVMRGARSAGVEAYYIFEHSFHTNYNAASWLIELENLRKLAVNEAALIAGYFGLNYMLGDVNKDGSIDVFDYLQTKAYILGTHALDEESQYLADVNMDGEVNAFDYLILKKQITDSKT